MISDTVLVWLYRKCQPQWLTVKCHQLSGPSWSHWWWEWCLPLSVLSKAQSKHPQKNTTFRAKPLLMVLYKYSMCTVHEYITRWLKLTKWMRGAGHVSLTPVEQASWCTQLDCTSPHHTQSYFWSAVWHRLQSERPTEQLYKVTATYRKVPCQHHLDKVSSSHWKAGWTQKGRTDTKGSLQIQMVSPRCFHQSDFETAHNSNVQAAIYHICSSRSFPQRAEEQRWSQRTECSLPVPEKKKNPKVKSGPLGWGLNEWPCYNVRLWAPWGSRVKTTSHNSKKL